MMVDSELINNIQAMKDENLQSEEDEKIKSIEKNKTLGNGLLFRNECNKSQVGLQDKAESKW